MRKKQIAVFDFWPTDCAKTAEAIRKYFRKQGIQVEVTEFTEKNRLANVLLQNVDTGTAYDMTFLCVDNRMGMETARAIRELNRRRPMFLVSEESHCGPEEFHLCALDYLIKPVSPRLVKEAVLRMRLNGLSAGE